MEKRKPHYALTRVKALIKQGAYRVTRTALRCAARDFLQITGGRINAQKKWTNCPSCGARKSMQARKNLTERVHPAGYPPLDIAGLDGQFCGSCGEGFWSLKSERRIARLLAEHMARHDATRVVAAELASVQEAAKAMHVTVQGVHKMMDEGRLRYVFAGGSRLPIRKDLKDKSETRHRALRHD